MEGGPLAGLSVLLKAGLDGRGISEKLSED